MLNIRAMFLTSSGGEYRQGALVTVQVVFLGQISALNDDSHSSHNLVQTLLKIGTRCPREEKQIPK